MCQSPHLSQKHTQGDTEQPRKAPVTVTLPRFAVTPLFLTQIGLKSLEIIKKSILGPSEHEDHGMRSLSRSLRLPEGIAGGIQSPGLWGSDSLEAAQCGICALRSLQHTECGNWELCGAVEGQEAWICHL